MKKWECENCKEKYLTNPGDFCLICGRHGRIREFSEITEIDECNHCGNDIDISVYMKPRDEWEEKVRKERLEVYRWKLSMIAQTFDIQNLSNDNIVFFKLQNEFFKTAERNKQTIESFSEEIDILEKRLEKLKHDKNKIISNRDNEIYELHEKLRQEREKNQELTRQLQTQQNQQFEAHTSFPPRGGII